MVLALAVHTIQDRPTAKVPLSMIALLDLVKRKDTSTELKCRQASSCVVQVVTRKLCHSLSKQTPPPAPQACNLSSFCCQVFPTSGQRSTSLWDVPTVEALQSWLDEYLDVGCTNEVFEVQPCVHPLSTVVS